MRLFPKSAAGDRMSEAVQAVAYVGRAGTLKVLLRS